MATMTETMTHQPQSKPDDPVGGETRDDDPYQEALASLERDGFVVLPATLFPSFDLAALREAASRSTSAARSGAWPYIRTLPKQFPPWPRGDASNGIWGVQHLMHPSNPDHATFAKSYFDPELLRYVAALIGCGEGELTMELYNMLVRPERDFALRWHRDDIPATATGEEEMRRLGGRAWHAQWNLALYDDSSLVVVPGSHRRARTPVEREADPYEDDMPGQLVVRLRAGEVAFYNNNILHRGKYDCTKERMTLHGSIGCSRASAERARNVLQHGVGDWVGQWNLDELDEGIRERAVAMKEKLVKMGQENGDVGFYSKDE